jgi:hypothetical protein
MLSAPSIFVTLAVFLAYLTSEAIKPFSEAMYLKATLARDNPSLKSAFFQQPIIFFIGFSMIWHLYRYNWLRNK